MLLAAAVLAGPAHAQFGLPANVNVGVGVAPNSITGVEAGDVDGDGNGDVVAVDDVANGNIGVARGLGGGAYAPPVLSGPTGALTGALLPRLADFDLDGVLDLVYAGRAGGVPTAFVARGDPSTPGAFLLPPQTFGLAPSGDVTGLATTDFDGDGNQDVLAAVSGTSRRIVIVPGRGGMTFGPLVSTNTVSGPTDIDVCVDFDKDGRKDLVVCEAGPLGNLVSVYRGAPTTTLLGPPIQLSLPPGVPPADVHWRDCDQDQVYDLAIAVGGANPALLVARNLGPGGGFFQPSAVLPPVPLPAQPTSLLRLDVNADGGEDLTFHVVTTAGPASLVVLQTIDCQAGGAVSLAAGAVSSGATQLEQAQLHAAQDQDFDGRIDLLAVDHGPNTDRVLVYRNGMDASLRLSPVRPLLGDVTPITLEITAGSAYANAPFVVLFSVNGTKPGVSIGGASLPLNAPFLPFTVAGTLSPAGTFAATSPPLAFPAKPTGFSLQVWAAAVAQPQVAGVPLFTSTPALVTVP